MASAGATLSLSAYLPAAHLGRLAAARVRSSRQQNGTKALPLARWLRFAPDRLFYQSRDQCETAKELVPARSAGLYGDIPSSSAGLHPISLAAAASI